MKRIPLANNRGEAFVDDSDYDHVANYRWHRHSKGYAATSVRPQPGRPQECVMMHRMILGLVSGDPDVDHVDGNKLNNRRSNLRPASKSQNSAHRKAAIRGKTHSIYKGVSRKGTMWRAQIGQRREHLGTFATEQEAAEAYDQAAAERYGDFAKLNFNRKTP